MTTKGQIVIPKALREAKGFAAGVGVELVDHPEGVLLKAETRRAAKRPVHALFGLLKHLKPSAPVSIEDMHTAAAQAAVERYLRSDHDRN